MSTKPKSHRDVVVVTGASAGVGRATVREFARLGARIGLVARGPDRLEAARREVEELGGEGLVLEADVADADQVEAAAQQAERTFGAIDVWVNNAMASVFSPVRQMAAREIRRVTEVTYLGTVHGTQAALKRMLPRNRGCIVQVGSALAYRSIPFQSAYCAAKHAVVGFTESLRSELIHDRSKVRLTMVHLPAMNTPQFDWAKSRLPRRPQPVPPIYQPEVAARAIVWAAHHPRREFYVGLPTVKAIVGDKLFPGLLDGYLARMAYDAHQTDEQAGADQPGNLWAPPPGDPGSHGRFGTSSRRRSLQTWASRHRLAIGLCLAALVPVSRLALRSFWR